MHHPPRDDLEEADPLVDLAHFYEKQLVIVGGFGTTGTGPAKAQQWRDEIWKFLGDKANCESQWVLLVFLSFKRSK